MLVSRFDRCSQYLSSVDSDKLINPFIYNIMCVNWQGSGKDLLLNAELFSHYMNDRSLFDELFRYVLFRPNYVKHFDNVYSNSHLNCSVYGDDFYFINSLRDIRDAHNGVLYINDAESWFNSRGVDMYKPSQELLDLVNNSRKASLCLMFSCHRYMSIDVKIRELIHVILIPDIKCIGDSEGKYLRDYTIVCKVLDCYGRELISYPLYDIWKYVGLYDTGERAVALIQRDL